MYVQDRHAYHVSLTRCYSNSDQLVSTLDSLWKLSKQALVEFYTLDSILYNDPQSLEETFVNDPNPHVKTLLALIGDAYQCQKSLVALMKSQYQEICGCFKCSTPLLWCLLVLSASSMKCWQHGHVSKQQSTRSKRSSALIARTSKLKKKSPSGLFFFGFYRDPKAYIMPSGS